MNRYVYENARFTLLREGAVRIEYSEDGAFVDEETFFARRDAVCDADFRITDGVLTAETPKLILKYSGGGFSAGQTEAVICS